MAIFLDNRQRTLATLIYIAQWTISNGNQSTKKLTNLANRLKFDSSNMKNQKVAKYSCWFLINQHIFEREFETIEQNASKIFLDFISEKNYGVGVAAFRFDIYVEPNVNFARQRDSIYTSCSHLSAHIAKQYFDKATNDEKVKMALNASLILLKYLVQRVPLPKDFDSVILLTEYEQFLKSKSLLLDEIEINNFIIKSFDTTRFIFRRTETVEVDKSKIHFDLNDIQQKNFIKLFSIV